MVKIALGLEYNGQAFCGWQTQPNKQGVQDYLEAALQIIAGQSAPLQTIVAGRTDTGVHALEQVVHFEVEQEIAAARPLQAWIRGVNAHLPKSVRVLWARIMPETFHARFSATSRIYEYRLINEPIRPALQHGFVGWFHQQLDLEKMQEAASYLIGTHDFSAFRASECQAKSPVRTLIQLNIKRDSMTPTLILFELQANAFLHHMVRNIIGTLIYIGKGKYPPIWIKTLLAMQDRRLAPPTFMSDGLYFKKACYPAHFELC